MCQENNVNLLEIDKLTCAYGEKTVLRDLSLAIPGGQLVGLLGANGSGKTTLLKCIGNAVPASGRIVFNDGDSKTVLRSLSQREIARRISYIPQVSGITIDLSCREVVLMGLNPVLGLFERPDKKMLSRAESILSSLGLGDRIDMNYQLLSQGQKQLCLFARTLISDAALLLLDEPESALDFGNRYTLVRLIRNYIGNSRSALLSLHDPQIALNYCDTVRVLHNGRCSAVFAPGETPEKEMEAILSEIYGPVCIRACYNDNNRKQFVLLAVD